jgi:hypothetical protein
MGSAPDRSYQYSIYVYGPYRTTRLAARALRALPRSKLGFRGWKYLVVGPAPYAYTTVESLIAVCFEKASGQHYTF